MSESFLAGLSSAGDNPADNPSPAPAGEAPPSPEPAPPAADNGWLAGLPEDLRPAAEGKNWQGPADLLRDYQDLAGRALPENEDDQAGYDRVYKALGRPDSPEGYELLGVLKEGEYDKGYLDAMGRAMHEAGLSKRQALALTEANQTQYRAMQEAQKAGYLAQKAEAEKAFSAEEKELISRGFSFLELEDIEGVAVENFLGVQRAARMFERIGRAVGLEDRAVKGAVGKQDNSRELSLAERLWPGMSGGDKAKGE